MLKPTQQHQASWAVLSVSAQGQEGQVSVFTLHYRCTVTGLCRILYYCRFLYISSTPHTIIHQDSKYRNKDIHLIHSSLHDIVPDNPDLNSDVSCLPGAINCLAAAITFNLMLQIKEVTGFLSLSLSSFLHYFLPSFYYKPFVNPF